MLTGGLKGIFLRWPKIGNHRRRTVRFPKKNNRKHLSPWMLHPKVWFQKAPGRGSRQDVAFCRVWPQGHWACCFHLESGGLKRRRPPSPPAISVMHKPRLRSPMRTSHRPGLQNQGSIQSLFHGPIPIPNRDCSDPKSQPGTAIPPRWECR